MTVRSPHRRQLVALVAFLSLVVSACGLSRDSTSGAAASVTFTDGTTVEISTERLDSFYDTLIEDEEFVTAAYGEAGAPPGLRASMLSDMVIDVLIDDSLADLGAAVSAENAAEGVASIEGVVASLFPTSDDPEAEAQLRFETLPYLPFLADLQGKQFQLGESLAEASGGGELVEVPCSSHILLETEEEANEVIALLDEGGDFAELAMEYSTGPSGPNGGELGCTDPARFTPAFAEAIVDAPVDTIIGPVQTEFGFHVITVTGYEEQTVGAPDPQQLVGNEIQSQLSQVTVVVDPTIGEWDATRGQVVPPG